MSGKKVLGLCILSLLIGIAFGAFGTYLKRTVQELTSSVVSSETATERPSWMYSEEGVKASEDELRKQIALDGWIAGMNQRFASFQTESKKFETVRAQDVCAVFNFTGELSTFGPKYFYNTGYEVTAAGRPYRYPRAIKEFPEKEYSDLVSKARDALKRDILAQLNEKGFFESCKDRSEKDLVIWFLIDVTGIREYSYGGLADLESQVSNKEHLELFRRAYLHAHRPGIVKLLNRFQAQRQRIVDIGYLYGKTALSDVNETARSLSSEIAEGTKTWGFTLSELGIPRDVAVLVVQEMKN